MRFVQSPRIENTPDGRKLLHVTMEIPSGEDMPGALELETALQHALNEIGASYMTQALAGYDTQGEEIMVGNFKFTSKGLSPETYQTLFGPVHVERHVYQNKDGGRTLCPLEERTRIVENATVGLCRVLASKHTAHSSRELQKDIRISNQLTLHVSRIQDITNELGTRALGKEERWPYKSPEKRDDAVAMTVYLDGTCVALVEERFKEVMVGAIDLLGLEGERLETLYIAQAPEEGKTTFFTRMDRELTAMRKRYPDLYCEGLSDGAPDLQEWLEERCEGVTLDFYHVSEYVCEAAAAFGKTTEEQKAWTQDMLHKLKHRQDGASLLLRELRRASNELNLSREAKCAVERALGYVERNIQRMSYKHNRNMKLPMGSGVIEAACKHVVKQRVAGSGMRWKRKGLQGVLTLRSLYLSTGRWEQFWRKVEVLGW